MRGMHPDVVGGDGQTAANLALDTHRSLLCRGALVVRLAREQNRAGRQRSSVGDGNEGSQVLLGDASVLSGWRVAAVDKTFGKKGLKDGGGIVCGGARQTGELHQSIGDNALVVVVAEHADDTRNLGINRGVEDS